MHAAFENGHGNTFPGSQMKSAAVPLHGRPGETRNEFVGNSCLRIQSAHHLIQSRTEREGNLRCEAARANVFSGLLRLFITMQCATIVVGCGATHCFHHFCLPKSRRCETRKSKLENRPFIELRVSVCAHVSSSPAIAAAI